MALWRAQDRVREGLVVFMGTVARYELSCSLVHLWFCLVRKSALCRCSYLPPSSPKIVSVINSLVEVTPCILVVLSFARLEHKQPLTDISFR